MNRLLTYAVVILLLVAALMFGYISHLQNKVEEGEEYQDLYKASAKEAKVWKDKNDQWHSKVEELTVSNSTLKQMVKQDPDLIRLISEVKDIKKNLSNLKTINVLATQTNTNFKAPLKDTTIIFIGDTTRRKVKQFNYKGQWETIGGYIFNDSIFGLSEGVDTTDIAGYFTRKWFLGKKRLFVEAVSGNPDTRIIYNRAITIKRRRK
jgi:hypothetical protein